MSEALTPNCVRFSYADDGELDRKLIATLEKRGYHVTRKSTERITVGELARRVGRPLQTVSAMLHRDDCPLANVQYGFGQIRKRILWLEPTERLIDWLKL